MRLTLPRLILSVVQRKYDFPAILSGAAKPPAYFNFTNEIFEPLATESETKDRPALWFVDRGHGVDVKYSFHDLFVNVQWMTGFLCDRLRIKPHDRIIVILPKIPEWWIVNLVCLRIGKRLVGS
ncbi:unnamed protein product [Cyprideis torosa]|uniref:Uncharacterized protein n=1 Tax=Cyprideis torosa TaxID=163714 RepID=A0A7R8WEA9_9CRUS|nr:unnamed protein product [Cyprideis torosa]CAG0890477.1 unnamed protein product [Cyprideis torosa]